MRLHQEQRTNIYVQSGVPIPAHYEYYWMKYFLPYRYEERRPSAVAVGEPLVRSDMYSMNEQ